MYMHKHICRTDVANDRQRKRGIYQKLIARQRDGQFVCSNLKIYLGLQGKTEATRHVFANVMLNDQVKKTIRYKWFKIHTCSIQIQSIILKVKWNWFNYFLIVRNYSDVFDISFGQPKYEYLPRRTGTRGCSCIPSEAAGWLSDSLSH